MTTENNKKEIIQVTNLKSYFFDHLNQLNNNSLCPIPQEMIFYSSDVLEKFLLTQQYYDFTEGRVREKILGIKLLEALQYDREEQKRIYKEVGDTALFMCGYFSESVNRKILDISYYAQVGKIAYDHLNGVVPKYFDIPSFYSMVATSFEPLTMLISRLASLDRFENESYLINLKALRDEMTEEDLIRSNIIPSATRKVS